jgi:hypothetical protein
MEETSEELGLDRKIILKWNLEYSIGGCRWDSSGSG